MSKWAEMKKEKDRARQEQLNAGEWEAQQQMVVDKDVKRKDTNEDKCQS